MHRGEPLVADDLLDRIGLQYPTDRMVARLLGFIAIARGDYLRGLEIADRCPVKQSLERGIRIVSAV